jgi:hypothetical protein
MTKIPSTREPLFLLPSAYGPGDVSERRRCLHLGCAVELLTAAADWDATRGVRASIKVPKLLRHVDDVAPRVVPRHAQTDFVCPNALAFGRGDGDGRIEFG